MQKKSLAHLIGSVIFLFLLIVSIIFARPIYRKIVEQIDETTRELSNILVEKAGLKIKYKTLSPSILTSFNINGIQVFDQEDNQLVEINKIKVNYNLRNVLTKDIKKIIRNVVLDGIDVDGTKFVAYITKNFPVDDSQNLDLLLLLNQIEANLPGGVNLKNLHITYEDSDISLEGNLKKSSLSYSDRTNAFDFSADAGVSICLPKLSQNYSGNLSLNAFLFPDKKIDYSSFEIKISKITDGNFNLNNFKFLLVYAKDILNLKFYENDFPLDLEVNYNFATKDIDADIKTKSFYPKQLITISDNAKENQLIDIYKLINDVGLSVSAKVDYNLDSNRFAYSSSGSVEIPESLVPGGLQAEYSVFGNDKKVNFPALNIKGSNYLVSADVSYVFDKFQLSGVAEIPYYKLPDGKNLSTEIYFDSLDRGFMAFSPQIFIGDNALTALQMSFMPLKDSVDFTLEVDDYSHIEESDPGRISIDGSYLFDSNYLQTSLSLNSIYADSLASLATSVLEDKYSDQIKTYMPYTSSIMLSADAYLSTDLKSISFNIPYVLLVDTKKDNFAVMVSANGNEQSIQLNQLNVVYDKQMLTATASLDRMPDSSDMFVLLDFNYGSVPYHLSGTIMPEVINFSGAYGLDLQVSFNKDKIGGHAIFDNLPLKMEKATFAISLDAGFNYTKENGPEIQISRFLMEETGTLFESNPKLSVVGNATKYGAQFSSISFSDVFSTLEGTSDININIENKTFDSAGMNFVLKNPLSEESITANITVSTPENLAFEKNVPKILESLYIDSQILFSNFSLNRFMSAKNDNNEFTMSLFMTGPISHPYVSLNVEKLSFFFGGQLGFASGMVFVEDRDITISDFAVNVQGMNLNNISAQISLEKMTGVADAVLDLGMGDFGAKLPFHLEVSDSVIPPDKFIPDQFNAVLSLSNASGNLIKKPIDVDVNLMYLNKNISFFSSENVGMYGSFGSDGNLFAKIDAPNLAKAEVTGYVHKDESFVKISNLNVKLMELFSYLALDDYVQIKGGEIQGSFSLSQKGITPDWKGALVVVSPTVQVPIAIPYDISTDKIRVLFDGNSIRIPETFFTVKNKHKFTFDSNILMNNWLLDNVEVSIASYKKDLIPINIVNPMFSVNGNLKFKLKAVLEDDVCDLDGYVFVENVVAKSSVIDIAKNSEKIDFNVKKEEQASKKFDFNKDMLTNINVHTNLILQLGSHVMVDFDPVLRCIFSPNTTVGLVADFANEDYVVNGSMNIKSGDISYLNRNFYIKEGNVKFNPGNLTNPVITIRAETREKDERGENVRIILSAENQLLSDFTPKFSSIPSRSEAEIQTMLGQIVIGDTDSGGDIARMAGDYALQSLVFRNVENKLRNVMNIDIFSVRTNILQNATDSKKNTSPGSIFDNSSLYMGRYFGDMFYFDAMLNYSYNDSFTSKYDASDVLKGILPEIGVELELPFTNFMDNPNFNATSTLRWSMNPDVAAMISEKKYIPASSVTLSWKFSF